MSGNDYKELRAELEAKKQELEVRLARITANVRRGYHPDSKERAKEMEDSEVVDALGNETRAEIGKISAALQRIDAGDYGTCKECGNQISEKRLGVYPYANECIDCARLGEQRQTR